MEANLKYTILHRVLHWVMAFTMPIMFITGFLRMEWISKKAVNNAISSQGIEMTKDQTREVFWSILSPAWDLHEVFAKVVIIAFIIRIIYMIVKGVRFPNPFKSDTTLKLRMQGLTYVYFYIFIFIQAFTGICLQNGFLESWEEGIETTHKIGIYLFPIFIVLHFGGILIAELTDQKGIASEMIGGDRQ